MVAGFASGFAFSLVSGVAPQSGPSLQAAFSSGVVFAVFQGGIYAVRLPLRQPAEHTCWRRLDLSQALVASA